MLIVGAIGTQYVIASQIFEQCFIRNKGLLFGFIALASRIFHEYSLINFDKTELTIIVKGFQKGKLIRWELKHA